MLSSTESNSREYVNCPYCGANSFSVWASENGYSAVKCGLCGFVYVNPRPSRAIIDHAVTTGKHHDARGTRSVVARRVPRRVIEYQRLFRAMFEDVWSSGAPVRWLDVGAGYGEIVEAVARLAPMGSTIEGIEPMEPKVVVARRLGVSVRRGYLADVTHKYDFISLVHVFSHIPDFRAFLGEVRAALGESGQIFLETGNAADLADSSAVPTELDLPDHLAFAGRAHLVGFLREAGFKIVEVRERRRDGLLNCFKNLVKKTLGRNVHLRIPYTSAHRAIAIRAKRF